MALFTSTASAQSAVAHSGSDIRTQADWSQYINTYYDDLVDELAGEIDASQLAGLFREESQSEDVHVRKTKVRGHSVAGINEDGSAIPFLSWGQGWEHSHYVYPYRIGVKHTRHLEELENYGEISQEGMELKDSVSRTVYYALADAFNRCLGTAGAPFLCYDGMYLLDSARPNPVVGAPTWSNLESTSDIDEDALFQAQLNAQNTLAHNGDRMPLSIKKIYIPDDYDKEMWTLRSTAGTVGTAMNDANWARGRFEYETVAEFTSNIIIYTLGDPKSDSNGLQIKWAVRPEVKDVNFEDPDVIGKRIRLRWGLACDDPRAMFRGGALNSL